jgi:para-nitrobenzyl esterase
MLAIAVLALGLSTTAHADSLTVKTEQGNARGKAINDGRVRAFLGLPYAAPPVGILRWREPQPPVKWKGVRDATRFGAHCAQKPLFVDTAFLDSGSSEDCLFLNVYVPAESKSSSELPVMFWIHGGGYDAGAGSEPRQSGDFLPLKGVVLVTINYRLGVFGFLATSELVKEGNGTAGNYGVYDMVAALQWVKDNIRNFGGDPHNVTIFGESSGSYAVCSLMASPLARGLFQKAIGESGAAFELLTPEDSLEAQEQKDEKWMALLGVKSLQELRSVPADRLLDAAKGIHFDSVIDGRLLTQPVPATFAAGRQAHVPLLTGWNRDEGAFAAPTTVEQWTALAAQNFKSRAAEFLALYPGSTDEQATRSAIDYAGDRFIAFDHWKWIEAHRKTGDSPIYRYRFDLPALPSKFHPVAFAFHSDEIEYVFGTLDSRPGETVRPEDRKLSEQMMSYWTNFARTGDPNGPGLPPWPKYDSADSLIHLDSTITSGSDTLRPRYEFLLNGMP